MTRPLVLTLVAAFALVLAGCGDEAVRTADGAATTTSAAPTTRAGGARLRLSQHQTGCCYTEGQISTAILRGPDGDEVVNTTFMARAMVVPVLDRRLEPGTYEVESYQRPCDGNCGFLDPPTDRCVEHVTLAADETVFLTASFAPGSGCTITRTDAPPASEVPDAFALRSEYHDCGQSFSGSPGMGVDPKEPARRCFLDANDAGTTAELTLWADVPEVSEPTMVIARTNADRTIDLWYPALGTPNAMDWRRATCPDLDLDSTAAFEFANCSTPKVVKGGCRRRRRAAAATTAG
ncbi:MAG: hypothetical protein U0Q22_07205 [Acidimicrobiales bacterium]